MASLPSQPPPSQPVDPSLAQGAQIPLQSFNIPPFPPQAQSLKALTLTSDIKLDEYQSLLEKHSPTALQIPDGIESLTLELFSLGYPAGFLTKLAEALPKVKVLVLYSQIFGGITTESLKDTESFFSALSQLRALHLLDVFGRPGAMETVGQSLTKRVADKTGGLMFLEVSYTFRHEDEDFLTRVPANDLPSFISPSIISCALNISAPDTTDDPNDPSNLDSEGKAIGKREGVMAFNKTLAPPLVNALTKEDTKPLSLKVLNTTLYTLSLEQLAEVLKEHKGLLVLNATVEVEPTEECKKKLLDAVAQCPELEQVELVANPSLQFYMAISNPRRQALQNAFPSASDMTALSSKCPKLNTFKATILRTTSMGTVDWNKEGGKWKGGITEGNLEGNERNDVPPQIRELTA